MEDFLHALGSGGVAPFTVLLTASLLYWLMVILGALDLDILHVGHGHDAGHHGGGHDAGHHQSGHHATESHAPGGLLHGFLEFLSIGKVPLTVVLSILVFCGWGAGMAAVLLLHLWWPLVLTLALAVAIPVTGIACRPLRALFGALDGGVATGVSLLGREARITSATCDATFGTATCEAERTEVLLRVASIRPELVFQRDAVVVIADHDAERDLYLVAPAGYRHEPQPAVTSTPPPVVPPPGVEMLPVSEPLRPSAAPDAAPRPRPTLHQ